MTPDMLNFRELVEKAPDADLLGEMIGFAAERLMEPEVGAVTGAADGEKDPARRAQRKGYRDRDWGEGMPERVPRRSNCESRSCEGQLLPQAPGWHRLPDFGVRS